MAASVSRRDFARLFAIGGSAALFADPVWAKQNPQAPAFAPTLSGTGEAFWKSVREQFVMPADLGVLNAANLCPSSRPVLEALKRETDSVDRDPSGQNRARLSGEKENLRKTLAAFLRVTPEEILITRNTSEANNMVSTGIDLRPGDEVVVFQDNHPSNLTAWKEKAKRFGFYIHEIPQVNPHPGMDYYVDAYKKAINSRTKIITFTHLTSTVGDLFPAKELCALAREHGVMSLVDGAQVGFLGQGPQNAPHSAAIEQMIGEETVQILRTAYDEAKALLASKRDQLEALATRLLAQEKIDEQDLLEVLGPRQVSTA